MPGFINNDSLRCLYDEAKDQKALDYETAKLWMAILNGMFPTSCQIYCVQEVPPAAQTRRKVDAKVYCYHQGKQRCLLYVEFKRAGLPKAFATRGCDTGPQILSHVNEARRRRTKHPCSSVSRNWGSMLGSSVGWQGRRLPYPHILRCRYRRQGCGQGIWQNPKGLG
jgi:hypothetical protein